MDRETILTSAGVAGFVTVVVEYAAKPWLEARKDRILAAHRAQREVRAAIGRVNDLVALFLVEKDHRLRSGVVAGRGASLEQVRTGVAEESGVLRRRVPELPYREGGLASAVLTAALLEISDTAKLLQTVVPDRALLAQTKKLRQATHGILRHSHWSPLGWIARVHAHRWLQDFRMRHPPPSQLGG